MRFICLGYADESKLVAMTESERSKLMEECLAYDIELKRGGHYAGGEALGSSSRAVTLRLKNNQVDVKDGPYIETKEQLGGILFLEARDLNHAIALMSAHPGVQFGAFEIREADKATNELIEERVTKSQSR